MPISTLKTTNDSKSAPCVAISPSKQTKNKLNTNGSFIFDPNSFYASLAANKTNKVDKSKQDVIDGSTLTPIDFFLSQKLPKRSPNSSHSNGSSSTRSSISITSNTNSNGTGSMTSTSTQTKSNQNGLSLSPSSSSSVYSCSSCSASSCRTRSTCQHTGSTISSCSSVTGTNTRRSGTCSGSESGLSSYSGRTTRSSTLAATSKTNSCCDSNYSETITLRSGESSPLSSPPSSISSIPTSASAIQRACSSSTSTFSSASSCSSANDETEPSVVSTALNTSRTSPTSSTSSSALSTSTSLASTLLNIKTRAGHAIKRKMNREERESVKAKQMKLDSPNAHPTLNSNNMTTSNLKIKNEPCASPLPSRYMKGSIANYFIRNGSAESAQNVKKTVKEEIDTSTNNTVLTIKKEMEEASKKCFWTGCDFSVSACEDENASLVEHVRAKHIFTQRKLRKFKCQWQDCKVYGHSSTNFTWLERHVIDHVEKYSFLCLFDTCKRKFRTEAAREKHVQTHINMNDSHAQSPCKSPCKTNVKSNKFNSAKKSKSPSKEATSQSGDQLINGLENRKLGGNKRNVQQQNSHFLNASMSSNISITANALETSKKHQRKLENGYSKEPLPAKELLDYSHVFKMLSKNNSKRHRNQVNKEAMRKFVKSQFKDFIDHGAEKVIEKKLNDLRFKSGTITFHANIIASQESLSTGQQKLLIEWVPKNYIENEWIDKCNFVNTKTICLSDLRANDLFNKSSNNPLYRTHRFRSNRRK